ncbi:MAG: serine hydrolase [Bacteroidales bacterium]|nr:serine hydrolase [Bacteroidales bacterium]
MYIKAIILITTILNSFFVSAQEFKNPNDNDFLLKLMQTRPEYFADVIENSEKYRLQIIYTQIDRDSNGTPHFTDYTYRLNDNEYYYCASMIKLPVILMTLEKLNRIEQISKYNKVTFDGCGCQKGLYYDTTAAEDYESFNHLIKKALVLSNNDAFNRMYDFLGQKYANKRIWQLGFKKVRILNRFVPCSAEENRLSCGINFYTLDDELVYQEEETKSDTIITGWHPKPYAGKGVWDSKTRTVSNSPKNFGNMNYINIQDLHKLLEMIFFPDVFPEKQRFDLTEDDYNTVRRYMGMLPRESKNPWYVPYDVYYDSYVKYYMLGNSTEKLPENIRIFDKVGMSFGFMADVAYIVDYENNVEFFLSSVIYSNKDEIMNNDNYEYRQIALPFFEQLGFLILDYEKKREKEYLPDLIKFDYSSGD